MLSQKLPKAKAETPALRNAPEALMRAAEERGPVMHTKIGLRKALHPTERVIGPKRKDPHWGRRKPARDR